MAQIDTSMYSRIQAPQIDNPLDTYAKVSQLQSAQQQNKLAQLAMGQKEREIQQGNALNDLYKSSVGADGTIDRARLLTGAAQGGLGAQIPGLQKGFADQDKSIRDAEKAQLEGQLKKFEVAGQIMAGVTDQATWERARQQTAQVFGPEAAAQMPAQYDPALIEQKRVQAMSVKDQLEQQWKAKRFDLDVNKFGYQQQNDAANRNVTVRGQNMTDARGREANALKYDENNIKRNEKKETADLTKNSQIASFDTMLGTLDRLSNHKGLSNSVGFIGSLPTRPGSESANFQAELNTFQSQAFLPMVAQLKGMGALSDAEGKKLTAAVGALDPKMGEEAFRESVARITADMDAARTRMAGKPRDGAPKAIKSDAEYNALPSGAEFIDPNGKRRRKP